MTDKRFTIIDLGSNSFHMLTVTKVGDGFSVFSKHKQKVRLALGLDCNNNLNQSAIELGLSCLRQFRVQLDTLQPAKIIITATAALRLANNKQLFITQAEEILKHPIKLISGREEAAIIYRGVAFTQQNQEQLLVIDIGGASTELIIGQGNEVLKAESLEMGCVTWLSTYFSDRKLNEENFSRAIIAAKKVIQPQAMHYQKLTWADCVGASGTIQAVSEVNNKQQLSKKLTLNLLNCIKQQCIGCGQVDKLNIDGLKESRKAVFGSGLAILIALFECFQISAISPSKGALREGLISLLFEDK